ncbi:hypothetical protein JAAARDRAFT_61438 [Jaapia argillacea MUCL 33604]|uniref:CxC2-like cysteine cluster KDZ transposase-associated domain-containing protein n=1 Tax=Jaapia argillacea MUCL 33604 TaxID=933084 RepID=A0A067PS26_9AGAM|nr:hypothetical protein JAAARDRAFT_61438 [Jaapia argillacea MUCL 33604]
MFNIYTMLERLTDNTGLHPCKDHYKAFMCVVQEWCHLKMLKRGGRGHDPLGASGTKSTELAIVCPACPHPGINLPATWDEAPKEMQFLYFLFVSIDMCSCLKRQLISNNKRDPGLGTGWSYFVDNHPYKDHLLKYTDLKEMSTCAGLATLNHANTKFSKGHTMTGVGTVSYAWHEFILGDRVGDPQVGERYCNMDYIFASGVSHYEQELQKVASYNIICQWHIHLLKCIAQLPPYLQIVPKFHLPGHHEFFQLKHSLNYLIGAGRTDADTPDTKEMEPGTHHDTMDDH